MTSSVTILPNEIQQVRHEFFASRGLPDWLPYAHQATMLDLWDQHSAFLVTTGTGTGKTQAALAPVLRGDESAVFIYPTNALAHDQVTAMKGFAEKLGYRVFVFPDDEGKPGLLEADVILFQVTSESLDTMMERYRHRVSKGTVLKEHLSLGKKQLILLTNFDTLYLIETGRYRDSLLVFKALERCSTLVVDEFHLYRGLELAHALFIAVWAQTNNVFHDRIVFLSATPDTTTASLLDALFDPKQVGYDPPPGRAVVQSTQASKQVTMHVCSNEGDVIEAALDRTIDLLPRLRQLHQDRQSDEDVPLVVIFNSVVAAMVFEDLLADIVGSRDDIGVVRGLMSRRYRQFRGKMVVIGTSAIEVGIDFKSRYLIFEASNAGSFLQRLGRVGRHTSGTVYLLRYPEATTGLPSKPLDRAALQRLARTLYPAALTYAWFPQTDMGLLVAALIAFKGLQQQYTHRERVYLKSALDGLLDFVRGYARCIHAEHGLPFVTRALRALVNAQSRQQTTWLNDIAGAITFRGSGLSLLVYDVIEPGRRGEPDAAWYDVAALDILTRAIAPSLQEKPGTGEPFVRVVGYGKLGDVDVRIAAPINKDALYGILLDSSKLATFDIARDGQLSQIGRWALDAAGIGLLVRQQDWNRLIDSWLDWTIRGIRLAGENQGVMVLGAQALLVYALMKQHGLL